MFIQGERLDCLPIEKIIDTRVQTNVDIINKNFSHIVTNALLFIDILAFRQYLLNGKIPEKYLKKIEEAVISVVTLALKIKTNKSKYDDLLIKLFENSLRYSKVNQIDVAVEKIVVFYNDGTFKQYIQKK